MSRPSSLVYTGNKYKTDEFLPLVQAIETGIHEADVMTGKKLIDKQVQTALEDLVVGLREGTLAPYDPEARLTYVDGQEPAFVMTMIRRRWTMLFERWGHPGNENLIGVLRTLLNSVDTFTTPSRTSRGYLTFLAGFLKGGGIQVQRVSADQSEVIEEEEDDPLIAIGQAWMDGDEEARREFYEEAARLTRSGEGERVAEAAQYLVGLNSDNPQYQELSRISVLAQRGQPITLP